MPVYRSFRNIPGGEHVVSIGTFDGVHLGHQTLLTRARDRARDLGVQLLVVTFEPNPAQVIRPESFTGRLNTPEGKLDRLFVAGADAVLVLPFTSELRNTTAEDFMREVCDAASAREVLVGEEFALGHDRTGTIERLKAIGDELGFEVVAMPRLERDGKVVSSSSIRTLILEGKVDLAAELLGDWYRVSGEVVHGAQVGRTIGFPTANVNPPELLVPVPDGIYATWAWIGDDSVPHQAMTYIGTRPALNTGARQIETNLLDFQGDLYGQVLHTDFVKRLRPDSDFPSLDALVAQLARDEAAAREVFSRFDPR